MFRIKNHLFCIGARRSFVTVALSFLVFCSELLACPLAYDFRLGFNRASSVIIGSTHSSPRSFSRYAENVVSGVSGLYVEYVNISSSAIGGANDDRVVHAEWELPVRRRVADLIGAQSEDSKVAAINYFDKLSNLDLFLSLLGIILADKESRFKVDEEFVAAAIKDEIVFRGLESRLDRELLAENFSENGWILAFNGLLNAFHEDALAAQARVANKEMIVAYISGDDETARLSYRKLIKIFPFLADFYDHFVFKRDQLLADRIHEVYRGNEVYVIGALHINGVVELLRKNGFIVTRRSGENCR